LAIAEVVVNFVDHPLVK